ncbi:MAG TPA: hypothetical protein VJG83_00200 [archaeon]|nr:hypothetical protein [archaeon]
MEKENGDAEKKFYKACIYCKSFNVKPYSVDEAFSAAPKYQCEDCGKIGMPIELEKKK